MIWLENNTITKQMNTSEIIILIQSPQQLQEYKHKYVILTSIPQMCYVEIPTKCYCKQRIRYTKREERCSQNYWQQEELETI